MPFRYREYREEPLTEDELRDVLGWLRMRPAEVLRRKDRANEALGLTGDEPDDVLLRHMAAHPTLLQRPIAVRGERAVVGRPAERVLELA